MTMDEIDAASELRARAEARLHRASELPDDSVAYELSVHRIELELQNDELRKSVEALELERERFSRMFDEAPIPYVLTDLEARIDRSNNAAERLLGNAITGTYLSAYVDHDDVIDFATALREMASRPMTIELRLVTAHRDTIAARISSIPTVDGLQLAITDVSDEIELRRQNQYASRLHDIAGAIILRVDSVGNIEHYNRFMAELSGVPLQRARGKSWFDLFVSKDSVEVARSLFHQSLGRGKPPAPIAVPIRAADGSDRVIQWTASAIENDGVASGMLYVGIDVTDLFARQRELRAERERNRAILETALDGIVTADVNGVIETFNPGAERLFGYSASEAVGMSIRELMPEPHAELHEHYIANYLNGGEPRLIGRGRELEARRKDGSAFPIHLSVSEIRIDDRQSFCAFIRDLTESKEAEARLRQAHKLEAVGTLASGVAHDFNNLLMGVGGCADIALSRLPRDSEVRPLIAEIRRSARSGAAITKQLLSFTRHSELETAVFELNRVIRRSEDMLRRLLGEDIAIDFNLEARDSRVRADLGQIEQVLMNLAVNARDAMEARGSEPRLSIETEQAAIDGRRWLVLRVTDTGEGMSDETQGRIFDPFFSTKPAESGTGLGLSVVYGIVTRLGGSIQVESKLGAGTTFEVLLPHATARITEELPAEAEMTEGPTRERTVLIAEDDTTVRLALRHYLETAGYRIIEAATGLEAIQRIEDARETVDLLLTDMVLPGAAGPTVAKRLVEAMPDAKVLYMSAHSTEWLVERGRLPAGVKTLHKPFNQARLLAEVDKLLSSDRSERRGSLLLVDDDVSIRRSLGAGLRELGYEVYEAATGTEALKLGRLHSRSIDALIIDAVLPGRMGETVARELAEVIPGMVTIFVSGSVRSVAPADDHRDAGSWFLDGPVSASKIDALLRRASHPPESVLVVEDNPAARMALSELLADSGADVATAATAAEALERIDERSFDVLLVDFQLTDTTGDRLVAAARERLPGVPVVYMSGDPDVDLGGEPCLEKPIDVDQLKAVLRRIAAGRTRGEPS